MSVTYTATRTAFSNSHPAASAMIVRLSRQRLAFSAGLPSISLPVSGSRCTWPLMNSMPLALTACEYGPAAGGPGSAVTVSREWDMGATYRRHAKPPRLRDIALSAAARREPRGLVSGGVGGVRPRPRRKKAGARLDRLRGLPLVPRHGARVLRGF